ncbi:hypothetical protein D2Q93_13975 [Alicyclobacillaceae bacterium I2511]|nr:hypothetical protein D2Q93_13975 [Alicyclobacillaceae bacterium I2511]
MSIEQLAAQVSNVVVDRMTLTEVKARPELVAEVLLEQREAAKRMERLTLRPLSRGLRGLMWLLRLYVLFMIAVVTINVIQIFH